MANEEVMEINSADELLRINDLKTELVEIPDWDRSVWIQQLSISRRDYFESCTLSESQDENRIKYKIGDSGTEIAAENVKLRIAALSLTRKTEEGKFEWLFKPGEEMKLANKSGSAINTIAAAALRLNGMSESIKEEAKNDSAPTPSDD
jgi:hypothetical protein